MVHIDSGVQTLDSCLPTKHTYDKSPSYDLITPAPKDVNNKHMTTTVTKREQTSELYVLTGGAGYVAERLALLLLRSDPTCNVILLDITPSTCPYIQQHTDRCIYRWCDLTKPHTVDWAFEPHNGRNITCCFHIASYGMSGSEMLNHKRTEAVNIGGTTAIIQQCLKRNVPKLVVVSTYNVIFGGQALHEMTEDLPYFELAKHRDAYSRTKAMAEEMVIKAHLQLGSDGVTQMHTCAIRPAAIWGDGERRHFVRIIGTLKTGIGSLFAVGSQACLSDWTYVDNLTHALKLASQHVTDRAGGQSFFIADDHPINTFDFLRQFATGLQYPNCFIAYIPTALMLRTAHIMEYLHSLINPHIPHQPYLTTTEVVKVGVHHYATMNKARKLLGYEPVVKHEQAMTKTIAWYTRHGYAHKKYTWRKRLLLLVLLFTVLRNYRRFIRR